MKALAILLRRNVEMFIWSIIIVVAAFGIGWGLNNKMQNVNYTQCAPVPQDVDMYILLNDKDKEVGCVYIEKDKKSVVEAVEREETKK